MRVDQTAGRFSLISYTDGRPVFTQIVKDGEVIIYHLTIDDLHDLCYALERQIQRLDKVMK